MAGGWSRDGAVQDQIDANLKDVLEWLLLDTMLTIRARVFFVS